MSCKKDMTAKQADYVYSTCSKKEVIGTEQMYKYASSNEEKADSDLKPYECAIHNNLNYTMSLQQKSITSKQSQSHPPEGRFLDGIDK